MEPRNVVHAGERYGGVRDPGGNVWWVATHIEDVSAEEQARRIADMGRNQGEGWTHAGALGDEREEERR